MTEDLKTLRRAEFESVLNNLGNKSAVYIRAVLSEAVRNYENIYLVTHVPPVQGGVAGPLEEDLRRPETAILLVLSGRRRVDGNHERSSGVQNDSPVRSYARKMRSQRFAESSRQGARRRIRDVVPAGSYHYLKIIGIRDEYYSSSRKRILKTIHRGCNHPIK